MAEYIMHVCDLCGKEFPETNDTKSPLPFHFALRFAFDSPMDDSPMPYIDRKLEVCAGCNRDLRAAGINDVYAVARRLMERLEAKEQSP